MPDAIAEPKSGVAMDQNVLVKSGQALLDHLDRAGLKARVAIWVHGTKADIWKLWIVPPEDIIDKLDFYRRVPVIATENRLALQVSTRAAR